jgi:hypothetical protein
VKNLIRVAPRAALALLLPIAVAGAPGRAAAAEPCELRASARELGQAVAAADAAFADMDEEAFRARRAEAARLVGCLGEGLTPGQAAAWHRLEALGAFLDRDPAAAVAAFKAVLAAAPGYALPESLAPDGHPLRTYLQIAAGTPKTPGLPLAPVKEGWQQLDGEARAEVPADRPFIYQRFDPSGAVATSFAVRPGQLPPELSTPARSAPKARDSRVQVQLAVTSGLAAVASGAFYAAARHSSATFWDPSTPNAELEDLQRATNARGWTSAGLGAVALGTGAAAFLVGAW